MSTTPELDLDVSCQMRRRNLENQTFPPLLLHSRVEPALRGWAQAPAQAPRGRRGGLTFEEDEVAVAVLVHRVDAGWQAPPEVRDLHGVAVHHPVVPDAPEPLVLRSKQRASQPASLSPPRVVTGHRDAACPQRTEQRG